MSPMGEEAARKKLIEIFKLMDSDQNTEVSVEEAKHIFKSTCEMGVALADCAPELQEPPGRLLKEPGLLSIAITALASEGLTLESVTEEHLEYFRNLVIEKPLEKKNVGNDINSIYMNMKKS